MNFVWLIERGQPENHVPTVWWDGSEWSTDAWRGMKFGSQAEADVYITAHSRPVGYRFGRAVEHGFEVQPAPAGFETVLDEWHREHPLSPDCYTCKLIRKIRAAHAKEVEEAKQRGYNHGAMMVAESRAAGKREMAREALEYQRSIKPRRPALVAVRLIEWLNSRAGEETGA